MTLPFVNDELAEYNNLPAIPPTQPLGDILNQLYAGLVPASQNYIIFRPGGVASATVATTWAAVESFIAANPLAPLTVYIDPSIAACTVPSTADTDLEGRVSLVVVAGSLLSAPSTLTVADGGILRNPNTIFGVLIAGAPTTQPFIIVDIPFLVVTFRSDAGIGHDVTSTAAAMDIQTQFSGMNLIERCSISPAGGAQETISLPAAGVLTLTTLDSDGPGGVPPTTFSGDGTCLIVNNYDAASKMDDQTIFLGTVTLSPIDYAADCVPSAGTTASRPTAPLDGQMYFDTDLHIPIWWEDLLSQWQDATGNPV